MTAPLTYMDRLLEGVDVEWKPLGEVGELIRGNGLQKKDFVETGVPAIHYGQLYTKYGMTAETTFTYVSDLSAKKLVHIKKNDLLIATTSENDEDLLKPLAWLGCNAVISGDMMVFHHSQNVKYLAYYFESRIFQQEKLKNITGTKVRRISKGNLEQMSIPIPPLHVQDRIVQILDKFTSLAAELTAELNARKKQYNYYRDKLLRFGPDVEWKPLGEIFKCQNGYTPSKANPEFWKNGNIPWFRMEDVRENGNILHDAIQKITKSALKGGKFFPKDSIIMATSATIGDHALIQVPYLSNQRFTNLVLKDHYKKYFNIKFIFYYGFLLGEWCRNNTTKSSFASVDMGGFKKFPIPVPPLAEQERIVSILDKFDALTHSITEGLPREIELRRKQYEHYRDMLLTFPKPE